MPGPTRLQTLQPRQAQSFRQDAVSLINGIQQKEVKSIGWVVAKNFVSSRQG
jgi:hypothetical protein